MKKLKRRLAALAAGAMMALSMGTTALAGGARPYDADITGWDAVVTGDCGKLSVISDGYGDIRYSAPTNCGPWYYEDIEEDLKQAFGVQTLEDRSTYPRVVSSNDPYEVRNAWKLMEEDPTRTCITVSNGTQVAKPGNGVKIRPGEYMYEAGSNSWYQVVPGDMNNSGDITLSDLTQWIEVFHLGSEAPSVFWLQADLNGDKEVTLSDLVMLAGILGKGPNPRTFDDKPAATTTPKPDEENLRMEYEPVYEWHSGDICWHCKADMTLEGDDLDVTRGIHSKKHRDEFLAGTAQRPNYFYTVEEGGQTLIHQQGSFSATIYTQTDIIPAPKEAHERLELICGVCDLNVTRAMVDPEEHRMQHARDGVEFGGLGFDFYHVQNVWVPAA